MRKPRSPRRDHPGEDQRAGLIRSPRATLFMLAAVGLLLWGRLLLKEVPQTASAVESSGDATALPAQTPQTAPPSENLRRPNKLGEKTGPEPFRSGQVGP